MGLTSGLTILQEHSRISVTGSPGTSLTGGKKILQVSGLMILLEPLRMPVIGLLVTSLTGGPTILLTSGKKTSSISGKRTSLTFSSTIFLKPSWVHLPKKNKRNKKKKKKKKKKKSTLR